MVNEKIVEDTNQDIFTVESNRRLKRICSEYCNHCIAFKLLPDPDLHDWYKQGNMKAVCLEVNGVIKSSLESPSEWNNMSKPLYCPKLGRKLTKEEKEEAEEELDMARIRFEFQSNNEKRDVI